MREPADVPMVRQHLPAVLQLHRLEVIGCCSGAASVLPLIHPGEDTTRPLGDDQRALGVGLAAVPSSGSHAW
jgi:hypothetical protein